MAKQPLSSKPKTSADPTNASTFVVPTWILRVLIGVSIFIFGAGGFVLKYELDRQEEYKNLTSKIAQLSGNLESSLSKSERNEKILKCISDNYSESMKEFDSFFRTRSNEFSNFYIFMSKYEWFELVKNRPGIESTMKNVFNLEYGPNDVKDALKTMDSYKENIKNANISVRQNINIILAEPNASEIVKSIRNTISKFAATRQKYENCMYR